MSKKTGSIYRKVETKTWSDEKFMALSSIPPCGQGLFLYLMTGPFTGLIPGIFRAGRLGMSEELNWEPKAFDEAFQEVFRQGIAKADWKAKLVWLPNAIKFNLPASPNVIISWSNEWANLPECSLKIEAYAHIKAVIYGMGEAFSKAFDKAIAKPSVKTCGYQEQEQEQEQIKPTTSTDARDPDLISAFNKNKDRLKELFPDVSLDIAFEKMLAVKRKRDGPFLEPYEAILKWMQMEFKTKGGDGNGRVSGNSAITGTKTGRSSGFYEAHLAGTDFLS